MVCMTASFAGGTRMANKKSKRTSKTDKTMGNIWSGILMEQRNVSASSYPVRKKVSGDGGIKTAR
jgi:hypothetical protein